MCQTSNVPLLSEERHKPTLTSPHLCRLHCSPSLALSARSLHLSCVRRDLSEFFDAKENFGASEVKVGRSWRAEELRIKGNGDLHCLWFVLLKERNMLLTMQEECKRQSELFPNPERVEKVAESMEQLEAVVRERNRAFNQLEVGGDGERPTQLKRNAIGKRLSIAAGRVFQPATGNEHGLWHSYENVNERFANVNCVALRENFQLYSVD